MGVKLEKSGIAFSATGQSEKLEYKIIGAAEDSAVGWKSENESVASVKDGVVTANGTGLTYITAGIKGGSFGTDGEMCGNGRLFEYGRYFLGGFEYG